MTASSSGMLILEYNLFDLPTAQHKAGLAGLLLVIESMRKREITPRPELPDPPTASTARIKLTPESLMALYDEFFAPTMVNEKPKPRADFLEVLGMPAPWLNLWRNVIANVLRAGAPAQFKPYRDRISPTEHTGDWDWQNMWRDLRGDATTSLSASDFIGAEGKHADRVLFRDQSRCAFLLLFAPVVSVPYVSQALQHPKGSATQNYRFQRNAFVLVTPEVSMLDEFVAAFSDVAAECLNPRTIGKDPYPLAARISIPEEGGLEFLTLAASRIVSSHVGRYPVLDLVASVQITHLKYGKGSPHFLSIGSLTAPGETLEQYEAIRRDCWNLLFREQRIRNLLNDGSWFCGMDELLAVYPHELFIQVRGETPPQIPFFGQDARRTFRGIQSELHQKGTVPMTDDWRDKQLASRIYWLMKEYVDHRTKVKTEMSWGDFKAGKGDTKNYREKREKVCVDAFLAMRSRHDSEFISYFVGTICTPPRDMQHDRYLIVSHHLLEEPDKVRTLAMLALSAHSYLWEKQEPETSNSGDDA